MLLERDRELGLLDEVLAGVTPTGGKVVLVRGEAGIGKTALVKEFVAAQTDTVHTLVGSCDDLLTPQPLGPFWDIARNEVSLAAPLATGDRPGLQEAILDLLSRSLRPTVLVVEDTQWADGASLDVIKYIGRRVGRTNGLLTLTYRDGEVDYDHPLRGVVGVLHPQEVVRIHLRGLSLAAVSSIVGGSDLNPDEVLAATGGNPFLVTQMASARGDPLPSSVQDTVMARAWRLSSVALRMLRTLSVVPERIPRAEAFRLAGGDDTHLLECERRSLLVGETELVGFRHELIRRAIESSLTEGERIIINRSVLENLPPDTDPARLVHHASEANEIGQLVELAPRAAKAAAAVGSHREAVDHFRRLAPHLNLIESREIGGILEMWAREEELIDNLAEAADVNEMAVLHYREVGERRSESGALAQLAHIYEHLGQRRRAEQCAREAREVLAPDLDGPALARALEINAYLAMMASRVAATLDLVDQVMDVAGEGVDERMVIRCLSYRGIAINTANYPEGRASLDEAATRAAAAGEWYEECAALLNHAWDAAEARDLSVALSYAKRAKTSCVRHEQIGLQNYATAILARILELKGKWGHAEGLSREQLDRSATAAMVVLPVLGVIEARTGRGSAAETLIRAWAMACDSEEFQRLGPAAVAIAEHTWISDSQLVAASELAVAMTEGLQRGYQWSPGAIAFWLWKLDVLPETPAGIAEPYRLMIEGDPVAAAEMWSVLGCPYERAIALADADQGGRVEALECLDDLGAVVVAAKLRQSWKERGFPVPRGRARRTKEHPAGLTVRQGEVLQLVGEGLSNTDIADRLFISPRTVERHVSAILAKLDSSTRDEAVLTASAAGLMGDQ